jgi:hypothetical protein
VKVPPVSMASRRRCRVKGWKKVRGRVGSEVTKTIDRQKFELSFVVNRLRMDGERCRVTYLNCTQF